jgi:hypothetical protein
VRVGRVNVAGSSRLRPKRQAFDSSARILILIEGREEAGRRSCHQCKDHIDVWHYLNADILQWSRTKFGGQVFGSLFSDVVAYLEGLLGVLYGKTRPKVTLVGWQTQFLGW